MCGSYLFNGHATDAIPKEPELDVDETIVIRVDSGETLSEIATRYGVTVDELKQWNRIENPDLIRTGQTIIIHSDGYTPPESVWAEAAFFFGVLAVLVFLLRPKPKPRSFPVVSPSFATPPPSTQPLQSESVSNSSPTIIVPPAHPGHLPIHPPKRKVITTPAPAPAPQVNEGERLVRRELTRRYSDWMLLNDVLLPSGYGTTQIDHILVSPGCVFLVETKDMNGWVFGSPGKKQWTQSFAAGHRSRSIGIKSKQFSFYNPMMQNEGHSKALINLGIELWLLRPIAVFVGNAELKTPDKFLPFAEHEKTASQELTWRMRGVICMSLTELHSYIAFSTRSASNPNMTRQTMESILAKIKSAAIPPTAETHARHVEYTRFVKREAQ